MFNPLQDHVVLHHLPDEEVRSVEVPELHREAGEPGLEILPHLPVPGLEEQVDIARGLRRTLRITPEEHRELYWRAGEVQAEAVLKATKVDGVYDSDPQKNPRARKYRRLTYQKAIADRLGTNHMTVIRTLNRLALGNVVDFRTAGRNKIYFLKRTLEGRNAVMTAEYYKLSGAVERYPDLRGIVHAVQGIPKLPLAVKRMASYSGRNSRMDSGTSSLPGVA